MGEGAIPPAVSPPPPPLGRAGRPVLRGVARCVHPSSRSVRPPGCRARRVVRRLPSKPLRGKPVGRGTGSGRAAAEVPAPVFVPGLAAFGMGRSGLLCATGVAGLWRIAAPLLVPVDFRRSLAHPAVRGVLCRVPAFADLPLPGAGPVRPDVCGGGACCPRRLRPSVCGPSSPWWWWRVSFLAGPPPGWLWVGWSRPADVDRIGLYFFVWSTQYGCFFYLRL
jgi:hypothetical protein